MIWFLLKKFVENMDYLFPIPERIPRGWEEISIRLPVWSIMVIDREADDQMKTRQEYMSEIILKNIPEE